MNIEKENLMKAKIDYLEYQVSNLSSLVRLMIDDLKMENPYSRQTRDSFNFQWGNIPESRHLLSNEQFRREAPDNICLFTGLDRNWFAGKRVIDIGCGAGRYSWAMAKLGAEVTSADQSDKGLQEVQNACSEFPSHKTMKINLLEELPKELGQYDLVWSFGVLHHTGNTFGAFKKIVPLVKDGGYLFLMIYGEPRYDILTEYEEVNEYEFWRHKTRNMSMNETLEAIKTGMRNKQFRINGEEYVHGYFDAISPKINDLHRPEEIIGWFQQYGFKDIKIPLASRNIFIIGRRV